MDGGGDTEARSSNQYLLGPPSGARLLGDCYLPEDSGCQRLVGQKKTDHLRMREGERERESAEKGKSNTLHFCKEKLNSHEEEQAESVHTDMDDVYVQTAAHSETGKTVCDLALAGEAQWIECQPENQRVAGSIPRSVHMPGLWARSPVGGAQEATTH